MTTLHTYSSQNLRADYMKAFIGMALCWTPFAYGMTVEGGMIILLVAGALFCLLAVRTAIKSLTKVSLTSDGVSVNLLFPKVLRWSKMSAPSLAYYSTWRQGNKGWMVLTLKGDGGTLRLESGISDFDAIVRVSLAAALAAQLQLDDRTLQNAKAMTVADLPGIYDGNEQLA